MNPSRLTLAVRAGFLLLVAVLAAFELLFLAERREGEAGLERTQALLEARAAEALDEALRRALDVGLARIEVLETLPDGDREGLIWEKPPLPVKRGEGRGEGLDGRAEQAPLPSPLPASQGEGVPRWVEGEYLVTSRGGELRGIRVNLATQLEDVRASLLTRGALLPDDALGVSISSGPRLVNVALRSPRLVEARGSLTHAFWLKSALLALTALLGMGVVLLERLATRHKEETLAVQREFISTVSHELRTPLAGIRLIAETLERKLGDVPAAKDYPRRLVAASDALGFLVENILSFNRIDSGRWAPKTERMELASLETLLREDAALASDPPIAVRCEGLHGAIEADPALIRILVLNLLRNAGKYGGKTFTVGAERDGRGLRVRFTDDGPGIPRAEWERVFEPFHRLDANVSGSGLGLALARRIAELHGGTLVIEDSSAHGTTFVLTVPPK